MTPVTEAAKERLMVRRARLMRANELDQSQRFDLAEIEAALQRINAGTFGRCEACLAPLGTYRLLAIPEARLCPGCALELRDPVRRR